MSPLIQAWQAIAYFLGEADSFPETVDWALLDQLAQLHRLNAALAEPRLTAHSPGDALPAELWQRWQQARTAALAQAVVRHSRLREVLTALAPLPVIILKGFALGELIYPSPGARSMGDVDILVPTQGAAHVLDDVLARLTPLGYRKQHPGDPILDRPDFHERQLIGPMDLDVHQGFLQPWRLAIDYRAIFERAIPWPSLAPNARLLGPEDAVAYAALHLANGEYTPEWTPAVSLLDVREMLRRTEAFWGFGPRLEPTAIAARAREWHSERMLFVALEVVRRLFPSVNLAAAKVGVRMPAPLREVLTKAIVQRVVPPGLDNPARGEVLLRKALLLRPTDRMRFAAVELSRRLRRRG